MDALTNRQRQVVRLVSLGCTGTEMARILGITESTVDFHRTLAGKKLGITRGFLLVRYAIESGISPIGDELTADERQLLKTATTI